MKFLNALPHCTVKPQCEELVQWNPSVPNTGIKLFGNWKPLLKYHAFCTIYIKLFQAYYGICHTFPFPAVAFLRPQANNFAATELNNGLTESQRSSIGMVGTQQARAACIGQTLKQHVRSTLCNPVALPWAGLAISIITAANEKDQFWGSRWGRTVVAGAHLCTAMEVCRALSKFVVPKCS